MESNLVIKHTPPPPPTLAGLPFLFKQEHPSLFITTGILCYIVAVMGWD